MAAAIDLPPAYEQAVHSPPSTSSHLPPEHNGISPRARRSMEDKLRPLPERSVHAYNPNTQHQFFIDTVSDHPRSTWNHPYDDKEYLSTLSPSERERIRDFHPETTTAESSADGKAERQSNPTTYRSLPRKLKDALTGTTHAQRANLAASRAS